MSSRTLFIRPLFAAMALTSVMLPPAVSAASHCKGLAETVCANDSSCRWVSGYTRKDGRAVAAHCRLGSPAKAEKKTGSDSPKISAVK